MFTCQSSLGQFCDRLLICIKEVTLSRDASRLPALKISSRLKIVYRIRVSQFRMAAADLRSIFHEVPIGILHGCSHVLIGSMAP